MSDTKIIAVTGATGAQGGGLVRAIRNDPTGGFTARAITRNPASDKAKVLAAAGVEVVAADLDDVESLKKAFAGCHGAYCVTNYWEHMNPDREAAQAKNMAVAAQAAGVKHVVWSTLEDTRKRVPLSDDRMPTLMERFKVPHFDAKGAANEEFTKRVPTTLLHTSFYWDNLIHFGMGPKPGPDGVLAITLPMGTAKLAGIGAEDIGACAYGVFRRPELIGKSMGIAGGHPTGAEMAASLTKALGREVRYNAVPAAVYRSFGFPGADDLGNMFQYYEEFEEEFCAARPLAGSRELNPGLMDFDAWLAKNGRKIPLE